MKDSDTARIKRAIKEALMEVMGDIIIEPYSEGKFQIITRREFLDRLERNRQHGVFQTR